MAPQFPQRARPWIAVLLAVGLAGCQSNDAGPTAFDEQIADSVSALQDGRLRDARVSLARANSLAVTQEQGRKVDSLELLASGAAALMEGDGPRAREIWAEIPDEDLRDQVLDGSERMGAE